MNHVNRLALTTLLKSRPPLEHCHEELLYVNTAPSPAGRDETFPMLDVNSLAALRANIGETSLVLLINEQGEKEQGRDERRFSWC